MAKKIHFIVVRGEDFLDAHREAENEFAERGIPCEARGALRLSDGATQGMGGLVELGGAEFPAVLGVGDVENFIRKYYNKIARAGWDALSLWAEATSPQEISEFDKWPEVLAFAEARMEGVFDNWCDNTYSFWDDKSEAVRECFSHEAETGVTMAYYGEEPTRSDCEGWYVVRVIL